jgi:hypothetical protein
MSESKPKAQVSPIDYKHLRAWNILLGSPSEYNLNLARKEKAPEDAIYRDHGIWIRFTEVTSIHSRSEVEAIILRRFTSPKISPEG